MSIKFFNLPVMKWYLPVAKILATNCCLDIRQLHQLMYGGLQVDRILAYSKAKELGGLRCIDL